MTRFVRAATRMEPDEQTAAFVSFAFLFALMFAYNVLKPVRDAMAPDWSDASVAWLWTLNFIFSVVAVSVYGFALSRVRLRYMVPGVYAFFATTFLLFYLGARLVTNADIVEKAFYVWVSFFALFHVSVFWSLMSDLFSKDQAPRLFAFIASGASVGTIAGAAATLGLAGAIGAENLMLVAALILVAIVPAVGLLYRIRNDSDVAASRSESQSLQEVIKGKPFAGFSEFLRNPFLIGIAAFIFLYTTIGSFAYFEIKNLLESMDRDARTQVWAGINLTVNLLAIATAWFATSRIASRFGIAKTLACVPLVVSIGFLVVAVNPLLAGVAFLWVVLKSGNYAITRPAREMLYTIVDREVRFKAKPVVDIVVYRGGDAVAAWAFASLTAVLGLGFGGVAIAGALIAVAWAVVGVWVGRWYDRLPAHETPRAAP